MLRRDSLSKYWFIVLIIFLVIVRILVLPSDFSKPIINILAIGDTFPDVFQPPDDYIPIDVARQDVFCRYQKKQAEKKAEIKWKTVEKIAKNMTEPEWWMNWIAHHQLDDDLKIHPSKVDIMYSWVNGSNPYFQAQAQQFAEVSVMAEGNPTWFTGHSRRRYQDHGELKHSLRSCWKYGRKMVNKFILVVNEIEINGDDVKLVPEWINRKSEWLKITSVQEYFAPGTKACFPFYNSVSIEAQLYNIPSKADGFFYISDDMMLGVPHTVSDMTSQLYGPSLSLETERLADQVTPLKHTDIKKIQGAQGFVRTASHLINRRFGSRPRGYISHVGRFIPRALMREAFDTFPQDRDLTYTMRFRKEGRQIDAWFLTHHYIIERHREAIMKSYFHKLDANGDGRLSRAERETMIADSKLPPARREYARDLLNENLQKVGLPEANAYKIQWTSVDGPYSIFGLDCAGFKMTDCLSADFATTLEDVAVDSVYKKIVIEKYKCGDCLIQRLLRSTERGLDVILPRDKTLRHLMVRALMRYNYNIREPFEGYFQIYTAVDIEKISQKYETETLPPQICLNDDIKAKTDRELTIGLMSDFMNKHFGDVTPMEK